VAVLFAASATALAAQAVPAAWPVHLALFGVVGLCFAGAWPLIVAVASERVAGHSGTVVGLTVAAGSLGCVAAPPLMALGLARLPPAAVFPVAALPLVAGALIMRHLARSRPGAAVPPCLASPR
jgi:MFS family permease